MARRTPPETEAAAMHLRVVERLTYAEIGRRLDLSIHAVFNILHRSGQGFPGRARPYARRCPGVAGTGGDAR
jgi:hypothetical protein